MDRSQHHIAAAGMSRYGEEVASTWKCVATLLPGWGYRMMVGAVAGRRILKGYRGIYTN